MALTSDFCLTRAAQCADEAAAAKLENVRGRCLRAQAAWQAMADQLLKGQSERRRNAMEKAMEPFA